MQMTLALLAALETVWFKYLLWCWKVFTLLWKEFLSNVMI